MTGPDGDLSSPPLPGNSSARSEKKRKTARFDPSSNLWMCSQCLTSGNQRKFQSPQAVYGHMHKHPRPAKQQAEGGASSSAVAAKRRKIHEDSDPNKKAPVVHEKQDEEPARTLQKLGQLNFKKMEGRETKSDGSAVAEGRGSLSAVEARGKKIHMKLNVNKDAPEAKVAEGPTSLSGAEARRKKIHMRLDLNKDATEDDERETKGDGSAVAECGASLSEAEARRKKIHMKLDLNNYASEDAENDDEEGA